MGGHLWRTFSDTMRGHRPRRLRLESLELRQLLAWGPQLVADVDSRGDSGISGGQNAYDRAALVADGERMYFVGSDGEGGELFVSDGTAAGTVALVNRDPNAWNPNHDFAPAGGRLFFTRSTARSSDELWTSDGTPAGTRFVADLRPDVYWDELDGFVGWQGRVFFSVPRTSYPDPNTYELWTSDGTAAGTRRVMGATELPTNGGIWSGKVVGDALYFSVETPSERQVWRLAQPDGPAEWVGSFSPSTFAYLPTPFVEQGGVVYFVANINDTAKGIWRTEGTPQSTKLVVDFRPIFSQVTLSDVVLLGDQVFFTAKLAHASPGGVNSGLFRVDESAPYGATQVAGLALEPSTYGRPLSVAGQRLFFYATDGLESWQSQLWTSDGTAGGTTPFATLLPHGVTDPEVPIAAGNRLYFAANDRAHGRELWSSDPALGDLGLVRDIRLGTPGSNPSSPVEVGGRVYFAATTERTGRELWTASSDGHYARQVLDLNRDTVSSGAYNYLAVGSETLFVADRYFYGSSSGPTLWSTRGTAETTRKLQGTVDDGSWGSLQDSLVVNDVAYLLSSQGYAPPALWRSDGTVTGTYLLRFLGVEGTYYNWRWSGLESLNGKLYILYRDQNRDARFFSSDGTRAGTHVSESLGPGSAALENNFHSTGNRLIWFDQETGPGYFLYSSDGTVQGTERVIVPELGSTFVKLDDWAVLEGRGYFATYRRDAGYELWRTDGTTPGTERVAAMAGSTAFRQLVVADHRLYFWVGTADGSMQLWTSDGTAQGTVPAGGLPIRPDLNGYIDTATIGDRLFFAFRGPNYESQLGVSDGTPAGTRLLPLPSSESDFSISDLAASGPWLYFQFDDGIHGAELWVTDGTPARTRLVADLNPGKEDSWPVELTNVGGDLYFTAADGVHGREPWILRHADLGPPELRTRLIDYVIWAAQFGRRGADLAADQDGSGEVGTGDYALWAARLIPQPSPRQATSLVADGRQTTTARTAPETPAASLPIAPVAGAGSTNPEKDVVAASAWLEAWRSRRR